MKKFKYKAINMDKKKFSGVYLAENESDLTDKLLDNGLFLINCKEIKSNLNLSFGGKVTTRDLASFCTQFSLLLDSSMEAIQCLEILKVQQKNTYFRKILDIVYEDVKNGYSISKAFGKHKKVFPNFVTSMVYVGEMSSSLNVVLKNLAEYIDNENKLKSKVKGALTYPIVIMILMLAIVILMMVFVIPTFRNSLSELDVPLPPLTKAIYDISDFFVANWYMIILGIVAFVLFLKLIIKTKGGRYYWDNFKIHIPLFSGITKNLITARFARGMGLLLQSGMKLVEAMEISKNLINNKYIEKKFDVAIENVKSGSTLVNALEGVGVFSSVFLQMVSVSEKSATLDSGMMRAAKYFDGQASEKLTTLTNLIQPIMLVIIGIVVAVIFLAVYMPMLAMMTNVG